MGTSGKFLNSDISSFELSDRQLSSIWPLGSWFPKYHSFGGQQQSESLEANQKERGERERKRGEGEGEGTVFLGLSTSFMGMDGGGTLDLLTVSRSLRGKTALEVIVARKRGLTKPQPFLKLMVKISS